MWVFLVWGGCWRDIDGRRSLGKVTAPDGRYSLKLGGNFNLKCVYLEVIFLVCGG